MFNAYYCLWYFTIYNLRFKTVLHGCDSRIFTSLLVFKAISCDHHLSLVDTNSEKYTLLSYTHFIEFDSHQWESVLRASFYPTLILLSLTRINGKVSSGHPFILHSFRLSSQFTLSGYI